MESTNEIINSWKNPKERDLNLLSHPAGSSFHELSTVEMEYISGGNGQVEPQATPATPTFSSVPCAQVSWAVSGAAASAVVSFVASAVANCRD
ncbi:mersacidin family lantibiotic [Solibacillus cecembensis]|uniref:mersacidin family lantibiotic n=1 Tax=Solibacillus cecembensis TaxID=459347 RepID=UPI0007174EF4